MPRKQAISNDSPAGAAPARAAKPKAPRVKSATHTKSAPAQEKAIPQVEDAVQIQMIELVEPVAILEIEEFPVAALRQGGDPLEEIARIAYGYWEARGYAGGDPLEDWVRAEREHHARHAA